MTNGRPLARDGIALSAARAGGQLVMIAVFAVLARAVGVERLGMVATALAVSTTVSGLLDFGTGSLWVREYAAGRLMAREFRLRSGGKLLIGAVVSAGLLGSGVVGVNGVIAIGGAILLASSVITQTSNTLLVAAKENWYLSVTAVGERVVLGAIFAFLTMATSLEAEYAFFLGYLCGSMLTAVVTWFRLPELRPSVSASTVPRVWRGSGYYGISKAMASLQATDMVLGAAAGGQAVVGVVGAVSRWTIPVTLATGAFATLLPAAVADARNRREVWERIRGSLWVPGLSVSIALVIALAAEWIVPWILGTEFVDSVPVLRLLAVAAALSSCAQIAMVILQARGRDRYTAFAFGAAVAIHLGTVFPFVRAWGAVGLAGAAVVGQGVLCAFLFLYLSRVLVRR